MPSPLAELLGSLSLVFRQLSLRWYLFGAQAAIVYGSARLTGDVDATVELGAVPVAELTAAMQLAGFTLRVQDVGGFVERTRVLPFLHTVSSMPVDVVLAGPGLEELFLQRAETHLIDAIQVPTACAEDMVAMKILAGRPKDVEDAVSIVAARQATIRIGLIRETLQLLEDALAQSDLLPAFEDVLRRSRG